MCPIRASLGVSGRKWALLELRDVAFFPPVRFSQIMRQNPGLTPRVLSMRLKELQAEGYIERVEDPATGRKRARRLTRMGRDTVPILTAFIQFGIRHHADKVFEDRKPRDIARVFPRERDYMLGRLAPYAREYAGSSRDPRVRAVHDEGMRVPAIPSPYVQMHNAPGSAHGRKCT